MIEQKDSEETFEQQRSEINDILDATKILIGNIVGSIGIGL